MDVSIIIVNYNTCELLRNCLHSIYQHTHGVEFEIIVVDNNSKDYSLQMLSNEFPEVLLVGSQENLGFGRANNLGIKHSKGKYLFFLNSDTLLRNNAVKIFYDYYCNKSSSEKIGVLGAILKSSNGENIHSYGKFITMKNELKELISKYLRCLRDQKIHHPDNVINAKEVDYITGADLFVPRKVYEEVNGFDSRFFMYCEEVDWQYRMAEVGYKRIIIPGPEIIHLEGGSSQAQSKSWPYNRIKQIHTSKYLFFKKHYSLYKYIAFRIIHTTLWIPLLLMRKDKINNNFKLIINLFQRR